ncbi:MAG: SURF1 family protein [Gemmatimonadetes bacterium]|nr:SURF1 family protein [Gemmatimonadota bacterium]MCB9505151.1 SURF1 family protein [Gemmatimonadales bacterium]MCB9518675.1 SURF1 family protein [Gemmatimonadales bacterium]
MSGFRRSATLMLVVVLAAVAVRLAFWQLSRLADRRAANATLLAARDLPPIDLGAPQVADSQLAGRRITARGRFRDQGTLLLRNRAFRDAPGLHVVSPFVIEGTGTVVWVLRGFVNAADGVSAPRPLPGPTPGTVRISGLAAEPPETRNAGQPLALADDTTWQRLDRSVLSRRDPAGLPVFVYLEGPASGPGGLPTVPAPSLDEGPHLSYAIQWFGIALAILTFGWVVVRRRGDRGPAPPPAAP